MLEHYLRKNELQLQAAELGGDQNRTLSLSLNTGVVTVRSGRQNRILRQPAPDSSTDPAHTWRPGTLLPDMDCFPVC